MSRKVAHATHSAAFRRELGRVARLHNLPESVRRELGTLDAPPSEEDVALEKALRRSLSLAGYQGKDLDARVSRALAKRGRKGTG